MNNRRQNKREELLDNFQQFSERFRVSKRNGVILIYDIANRDYYTLESYYNKIVNQASKEFRPRLAINLKKYLVM